MVLRLGWIVGAGKNMTTMCDDQDNSHYYYCTLYRAVRAQAGVSIFDIPLPEVSSSHHGKASGQQFTDKERQQRARATAIFLPHGCTVNQRVLPQCLSILQPTDPPAVIFLNKMFEGSR